MCLCWNGWLELVCIGVNGEPRAFNKDVGGYPLLHYQMLRGMTNCRYVMHWE